MSQVNNTKKGVGCASCNRKCNHWCRPADEIDIDNVVTELLIRDGVPDHLAELCAWLAMPLFELEYPDIKADQIIVETNCQGYFRPSEGYEYDIWIGAGYASRHSTSAWKVHFEFTPDATDLTWCNVAEWSEDDDRWRGVDLIYRNDCPSKFPPMTYCELRERIANSFSWLTAAEEDCCDDE